MSVSWADICREHREKLIGPLILAEVADVVRLVSRAYDPVVYARSARWEDGLDDLVQEVVLENLLQEEQLAYIMSAADNRDGFRGLVGRQVKRRLARRRTRSVVDNLLDRAKTILSEPPFVVSPARGRQTYGLERASQDASGPTDADLWEAARLAATVRSTPFRRSDRAPVVYAESDLRRFLMIVAKRLPEGFSVSDLDRMLRLVLTDWIPSFLDDSEAIEIVERVERSPEDVVVIESVVLGVMKELKPREMLVLGLKLARLSDGEIAAQLRSSRPTVAKLKSSALELVRTHIVDLEETMQQAVVDELSARLAEGLDIGSG